MHSHRSSGERDLALLRELIMVVDSYRANRFVNPNRIQRAIEDGKLGPDISREWKTLKEKMLKKVKSVEKIPRMPTMLKIYHVLSSVSILAFFLAAAIPLLPIFSSEFLGIGILPITIGLALTLLLYVRYFERRIAARMDEYFKSHSKEFGDVETYLWQVNQKFLRMLLASIEKRGEDPSRHSLSLRNADYKLVKIVKRPSRFGTKYKVVPSRI